jgi:hypothetical protein
MTDGVKDAPRNGSSTMPNANRPGTPWWRPLVDQVDRRVTPPANKLVRTNVFADTIATATRLEVRLRRRIQRQSTWLLHQYNLPAAEDIRKVRAQLAAVEARLRDVSERLEDQQLEARKQASLPRSKTAKPTTARPTTARPTTAKQTTATATTKRQATDPA